MNRLSASQKLCGEAGNTVDFKETLINFWIMPAAMCPCNQWSKHDDGLSQGGHFFQTPPPSLLWKTTVPYADE